MVLHRVWDVSIICAVCGAAERVAQCAGQPSVLHSVRDSRFLFAKGEGVPSDLHTAKGFAQGAGRQFHLLHRVRGFQVICTLPRVLHRVRDSSFICKGRGASK
jgi:hypothetical protein